jgi:signal peptidase II
MTSSVSAFLVALAALAADRIVKIMAVRGMTPGESTDVIAGVFNITLVHNTGAAFGVFKGGTLVFSIFSAFVIAFITAYLVMNRIKGRMLAVSLGLILGGAAGNLIDRVWLGYVIDMFDFRVWPVFNVADSCITVGTIILAFNILLKKESHASCTH